MGKTYRKHGQDLQFSTHRQSRDQAYCREHPTVRNPFHAWGSGENSQLFLNNRVFSSTKENHISIIRGQPYQRLWSLLRRIDWRPKYLSGLILQQDSSLIESKDGNWARKSCASNWCAEGMYTLRGHLAGDESIFTFPLRVKGLCRLSWSNCCF